MCAEKLNHHPDWSNSYNKVLIRLVTHQTNAITEHDIELAQAIQKLA
jgi:4a-hydroxytetrahydrobiopterin dehydratase